jgi:hypothetical protein
MIYLFTGDDAKTKHAGYEKFVKSVSEGTETFFISRNDFNKNQIESLYSGAGLFSTKSTVMFSNILEYEETRDFILDKLEQMGESATAFIFLEGKLNKPILDAFREARAELNVFELPKEKKEKFNNFLLADAFSDKDKLNLWVYYRQAVDLGVGLEELVGVLFWKAKDMLLKKNLGKFSEQELKDFSYRISYILPEARTSGRDAETVLEKFLLEVF